MFLDDAARSPSHPRAQVSALQGIGYALLAVEGRLGAVLDAADDRNTQLERIAAVELLRREPRRTPRQWLSALAWRWWGARRAERLARAWSVTSDGQPAEQETALLAGGEVAVVRQALAEADERHRALGAGHTQGCAQCRDLDPGYCDRHAPEIALADAYGGLWVRLGGGGAS